jgi:hypothetical protein
MSMSVLCTTHCSITVSNAHINFFEVAPPHDEVLFPSPRVPCHRPVKLG